MPAVHSRLGHFDGPFDAERQQVELSDYPMAIKYALAPASPRNVLPRMYWRHYVLIID